MRRESSLDCCTAAKQIGTLAKIHWNSVTFHCSVQSIGIQKLFIHTQLYANIDDLEPPD